MDHEMTSIYLASPYWHDDEAVRTSRFEKVTEVTGELMLLGYIIFSPITHSHPVSAKMDIGEHRPGGKLGHGFWLSQDSWYLKRVNEMWILMLDGWKESFGVGWETDRSKEWGKPIRHIDPNTLTFIDPSNLEIIGVP